MTESLNHESLGRALNPELLLFQLVNQHLVVVGHFAQAAVGVVLPFVATVGLHGVFLRRKKLGRGRDVSSK